jgi:hypothetical protein
MNQTDLISRAVKAHPDVNFQICLYASPLNLPDPKVTRDEDRLSKIQ